MRIPNHPVALALVNELGRPIISSTAARHGETPTPDAQELDDLFPGLSLVLDAGPCGTSPTTIVDLTTPNPRSCAQERGHGAFRGLESGRLA